MPFNAVSLRGHQSTSNREKDNEQPLNKQALQTLQDGPTSVVITDSMLGQLTELFLSPDVIHDEILSATLLKDDSDIVNLRLPYTLNQRHLPESQLSLELTNFKKSSPYVLHVAGSTQGNSEYAKSAKSILIKLQQKLEKLKFVTSPSTTPGSIDTVTLFTGMSGSGVLALTSYSASIRPVRLALEKGDDGVLRSKELTLTDRENLQALLRQPVLALPKNERAQDSVRASMASNMCLVIDGGEVAVRDAIAAMSQENTLALVDYRVNAQERTYGSSLLVRMMDVIRDSINVDDANSRINHLFETMEDAAAGKKYPAFPEKGFYPNSLKTELLNKIEFMFNNKAKILTISLASHDLTEADNIGESIADFFLSSQSGEKIGTSDPLLQVGASVSLSEADLGATSASEVDLSKVEDSSDITIENVQTKVAKIKEVFPDSKEIERVLSCVQDFLTLSNPLVPTDRSAIETGLFFGCPCLVEEDNIKDFVDKLLEAEILAKSRNDQIAAVKIDQESTFDTLINGLTNAVSLKKPEGKAT